MVATVEDLFGPVRKVKELHILIDGDLYAYRAASVTDGRRYSVGSSDFKYKKDADAFGKKFDPVIIPEIHFDVEPFRNCAAVIRSLFTNIDNALRYKAEHTITKTYLSCPSEEGYRKDILPYYKWGRLGVDEVIRLLDGDEEEARKIFGMTPATFDRNKGVIPRRPEHLDEAKEYIRKTYGAVRKKPYEADDLLGMEAMRLRSLGREYIIVTTDKDLNCIPGLHFNSTTDDLYDVTEEEALKSFYRQCLIGDKTDTIPGIKGIGPATAKTIIDPLPATHESLYEALREQWVNAYDSEEEAIELMKKSAGCLWIMQDWSNKDPFDKLITKNWE